MLRLDVPQADVPQAPEPTVGSSPVLGLPGKMLPWAALHFQRQWSWNPQLFPGFISLAALLMLKGDLVLADAVIWISKHINMQVKFISAEFQWESKSKGAQSHPSPIPDPRQRLGSQGAPVWPKGQESKSLVLRSHTVGGWGEGVTH